MTMTMLRRSGAIGAIGLVVALLTVLLPSGAGAAQTPKGPGGNAFYQPPAELPSGNGSPIWKRGTVPVVRLDGARYTRRVLYTSRSIHGERIAVSGTVSIPEGSPPKGGWPMISYAHGTTGLADVCAPSRNYSGGPASSYITYVFPQLEAWIEAGYAVVLTDYPGLGTPGEHPYLIGKSEGRGVVDMARAAHKLDDRIGKRFMIAGHSQGGHAALFAASLAENWAPGFDLRGTVSYAPASHTLQQFKAIPALTSPSALSSLAMMILEGTTTANAGIVPAELLNPRPLNKLPLVNGLCAGQLSGPGRLAQFAPADLFDPDANSALLEKVLGKNNPAVLTDQPILLAQGTADTTVLPFFTGLLADELVDLGDDVDYKLYEGVTHGEIVAAAEQDALAFIEDRLPPG